MDLSILYQQAICMLSLNNDFNYQKKGALKVNVRTSYIYQAYYRRKLTLTYNLKFIIYVYVGKLKSILHLTSQKHTSYNNIYTYIHIKEQLCHNYVYSVSIYKYVFKDNKDIYYIYLIPTPTIAHTL